NDPAESRAAGSLKGRGMRSAPVKLRNVHRAQAAYREHEESEGHDGGARGGGAGAHEVPVGCEARRVKRVDQAERVLADAEVLDPVYESAEEAFPDEHVEQAKGERVRCDEARPEEHSRVEQRSDRDADACRERG